MNMKTRGILKRIALSTVEGKLLRKTINFIVKRILKVAKRLDAVICIPARWMVARNTEIDPKKILFVTFQGDYTCNPKYITEQLIREEVDCEIVWAVKESALKRPEVFPGKVRLVKRDSYKYYKEWCSAKIIVVNSVDTFATYMPKKKEQILIQTWHGSLGIKRFGKDKAWTLLRASEKMEPLTDAVVSNSEFENNVYRDTCWKTTPIWKYGHPRNDILVSHVERRNEIVSVVREKYGILDDEKIVLYAPTFRNALNTDCYSLVPEDVIQAFEERFGHSWKLMVRLHPTARKVAGKTRLLQSEKVIDVTMYPDIQDLIVAADAFITDYSSCIFDFVLSRRPGFIFATDIELYNHERGFYYRLEDTPFSIAEDNRALVENIRVFDEEAYQIRIDEFLEDKGCVEDGHASERVVERIREFLQA